MVFIFLLHIEPVFSTFPPPALPSKNLPQILFRVSAPSAVFPTVYVPASATFSPPGTYKEHNICWEKTEFLCSYPQVVGQAILINVSPSLRTSKGNAETKGSLKSTFSLTLNGEDWSNFGVLPPPERKARFHYVTEDNIIFDNRTDSVPPWPFPTTTVS